MPFLLSPTSLASATLSVNAMVVGMKIAPNAPDLVAFVWELVNRNHGEERERVVRAVSKHDLAWTREILTFLTEDEREDVAGKAAEVLDLFDSSRSDA